MYAGTPSRGTPSRKKVLHEGPIAEFIQVIEDTPLEDWQKRSAALRKTVDSIPEPPREGGYGGSAPSSSAANKDNSTWYNSPTSLRHLANPIGELIKDPRSTVVKRTCESLARLFHKCQANSRYLFRDLMPTILSVHAQTVQVIRNAVQCMVMESIPYVPCKMVMPLWMERMKVDKSRTVRDACALYLGHCLQSWTEEGYLTEEIWLQVGTTLIRTLRDPSPQVRTHAKNALEQMQETHLDYWNKLLTDPEGPAARDKKAFRWLQSLGNSIADADPEELSVASKFSYNSDTRYAKNATARSTTPKRIFTPKEEEDLFGIPASSSSLSVSVPHSITYDQNQIDEQPQLRQRGTATLRAGRDTTPSKRVEREVVPSRHTSKPDLRITTPSLMTSKSGNLGPPLRPANSQSQNEFSNQYVQPSPSSQSHTYLQKRLQEAPPPPPPPPSTLAPASARSLVASELPFSSSANRSSPRWSSSPAPSTTPASPAAASAAVAKMGATNSRQSPQHASQPQFRDSFQHPVANSQTPPSLSNSSPSTPSKSPASYLHTIEDDGDGTESMPEELESNPSFPTDLNSAFGKASVNTFVSSPDSPSTEEKKDSMAFNFQEAEAKIKTVNNSSKANPLIKALEKSIDKKFREVEFATPSISASISEDMEKKDDDGPFIQSMQQLKQHASKRRSRNSILMQERFRMSGGFAAEENGVGGRGESGRLEVTIEFGEEENEVPNSEENNNNKKGFSSRTQSNVQNNHVLSPNSQPEQSALSIRSPIAAPEHMIIAIRLLRAHKAHVDQIMETLKIEMDTLRDFDRLLEEPGRPTENEVLDYFEGVGLCLDQRTQAGDSLQREMDRISRGEPPQE